MKITNLLQFEKYVVYSMYTVHCLVYMWLLWYGHWRELYIYAIYAIYIYGHISVFLTGQYMICYFHISFIVTYTQFSWQNLSVSGNVNYFMIIPWISSHYQPFKQLLQTMKWSLVCCFVCLLTGRSKCSEGFQQCPAQYQTVGGDHHRLPETEAGGYQSQSHTYSPVEKIGHPMKYLVIF